MSGDGSERRPRVVRETRLAGPVPLLVQAAWRDRWPRLVQGTTTRPQDYGLFGGTPVGAALARWRVLAEATGCTRTVHARQVHGARVVRHDTCPPGLLVVDDADGHVTAAPGVLLTVSIADCVPVFLAADGAVGLLHAGWRGVAAGVLEAGLEAMTGLGVTADGLELHLGPGICGTCYEVGSEVHDALGLAPVAGPAPVDLRDVLAHRAIAAGVPGDRVTVSDRCTRCDNDQLFSHRAGDRGRQLGVVGIRGHA